MKTYFVYDKDKDLDYIIVPHQVVLAADPKVFADFLYAEDLSLRETEFPPVSSPEDYGEIVAVLDRHHLQIIDSDLWAQRKQELEW
ncbi:MAG: hypothetical protein K9K79_06010 [Desulfohalobiaceae bacterium]|nr:hypothetical protein [Desulfohalobiaceae bacterium]